MKVLKITLLGLAILLSTLGTLAQGTKTKEYLSVPGPINFDNVAYTLSWSSNPSPNYFKQEYILKGDDLSRFKKMIMVEVLTGNTGVKEIVAAKLDELKRMKTTNPAVAYESFHNAQTGEYLLDFLVTQNSPDGKSIEIAERNVYRYRTFKDKAGNEGILLFAVSVRSYGKETTAFIAGLKAKKSELADKVRLFTIPAVTVKK